MDSSQKLPHPMVTAFVVTVGAFCLTSLLAAAAKYFSSNYWAFILPGVFFVMMMAQLWSLIDHARNTNGAERMTREAFRTLTDENRVQKGALVEARKRIAELEDENKSLKSKLEENEPYAISLVRFDDLDDTAHEILQ